VRFGAVLACALVACVSGAAATDEAAPRSAVVYTIGVSTNPYGSSHERGFGVATGLVSGKLKRVEIRSSEYGWFGGAHWLDRGRVLVHRKAPPMRHPDIFRYQGNRLERVGSAPFISGSSYAWSPDWRWIAFAPPQPCKPGQRTLFRCYKPGGPIFVVRADGSGKRRVGTGVLDGWTRDGRLVVYSTMKASSRGDATILDLRTGRRIARHRFWLEEQPIYSADGRYAAVRRGAGHRTRIIVSRAGGRVVRTMTTTYIVSMLAWSTRGHLLAYTTSGFPSPHQLFVVDPEHGARKIFATGARHFDWITWSPDGRWILLDGDLAGGWRVFSARSGKQVRLLPRLGGRPLWCCPVNEYRGNGR
jgi:Tol biopolymer transport system component